jgi:hypothetical protein
MLFSHLRLGLLGCLFPSDFPNQNPICIPPIHSSITFLYHSPWLHHSIWWRVQVMKLLIIQLSSNSSIFLRSRYFPQHPVLKYAQSALIPFMSESKFRWIHVNQN